MNFAAALIVQILDPIRFILCLILHIIVVRALLDPHDHRTSLFAAAGAGVAVGFVMIFMMKSFGRVSAEMVFASLLAGPFWSLLFWWLHRRRRVRKAGRLAALERAE